MPDHYREDKVYYMVYFLSLKDYCGLLLIPSQCYWNLHMIFKYINVNSSKDLNFLYKCKFFITYLIFNKILVIT